MIVTAYPVPPTNKEKKYNESTVIVVDVLRSSTNMLQALENGATQVIPVQEVEEARMLYSNWGRKESVLCGESGGVKIPGYDLGNSPFEYTYQAVSDKTVVLCTSNGTGATIEAGNARHTLVGCMRNRSAVAKKAVAYGRPIVLVCAGTQGECSADDVICVGGILQAIYTYTQGDVQMNDFALISSMLYAAWKGGSADLNAINHCKRLIELGFEKDIAFCFEEDSSTNVPVLLNGTVTLAKG